MSLLVIAIGVFRQNFQSVIHSMRAVGGGHLGGATSCNLSIPVKGIMHIHVNVPSDLIPCLNLPVTAPKGH